MYRDSNHQANIVETNQVHLNGNMKLSSDPMVDTQSVTANNVVSNSINGDPMFNKIRCKKNKENDKQFLELKSISKYFI